MSSTLLDMIQSTFSCDVLTVVVGLVDGLEFVSIGGVYIKVVAI